MNMEIGTIEELEAVVAPRWTDLAIALIKLGWECRDSLGNYSAIKYETVI